MSKITCFLPFASVEQATYHVRQLRRSPLVGKIYLLAPRTALPAVEGAEPLAAGSWGMSDTLRQVAALATDPYCFLHTGTGRITWGEEAPERWLSIAEMTGSTLLYADHARRREGKRIPHPLAEYQLGSLRDDFDFGPLLLLRSEEMRQAVDAMEEPWHFAALYDLRLRLSERRLPLHIEEPLYTEEQMETADPSLQQFHYVDPRNRAAQIEMERACTAHLRRIGAYLPPHRYRSIDPSQGDFPVAASVIIPVRNRARTIADAVRSALSQRTTFPFNVIVIDNHSTDGTTAILRGLAADPRLLHLLPAEQDLGIGGCWNRGILHPACGRFAIQLDSDDLYSDESVLQRIVDTFYAERCAMLVGSYRMTDFTLQTLPPGIIDHREWSDENGPNNALRVQGLGAPRAFYTPLLRQFLLPNCSYGEDYAIGLRISREYRIGRIYEVLYLCRRWEGNSDANRDQATVNAHNHYKDKLRSWEIEARITQNRLYDVRP